MKFQLIKGFKLGDKVYFIFNDSFQVVEGQVIRHDMYSNRGYDIQLVPGFSISNVPEEHMFSDPKEAVKFADKHLTVELKRARGTIESLQTAQRENSKLVGL